MTSQSLRKLQTILSNTLRRTDSSQSHSHNARRISRLLRSVGATGLSALLLASSVSADEPAASATTNNSRVPVKHATWTRTRSSSGAIATVAPVQDSAQTHAVSFEGTPPEFAQEAVQPFVGTPGETQVVYEESTMNYGFTDRVQYALTGGPVAESVENVGEWWQARAQRMVESRQTASSKPPIKQRLAQSSQAVVAKSKQVVENVTYDQGPLPENDFYEERPIAVTSSTFQEAPQEVAQEGLDATTVSYQQNPERTRDRLKTDIRTIKPTLGYAMKNIDRKDLPDDFNGELNNGDYTPRQSPATVLQWAPTNLYHYPLYFEDPSLERYGHTYHPLVQPFASTGRFAVQVAGLPYQMALKPVNSREYDLGYYRPGECAPKKHYQIPFNEEATLVEIATIAGLILIIP